MIAVQWFGGRPVCDACAHACAYLRVIDNHHVLRSIGHLAMLTPIQGIHDPVHATLGTLQGHFRAKHGGGATVSLFCCSPKKRQTWSQPAPLLGFGGLEAAAARPAAARLLLRAAWLMLTSASQQSSDTPTPHPYPTSPLRSELMLHAAS